ncbi:MAG: GAF domain-containing protein [Anaerolineales bacterium]|nr:GAF domain-containing protein [Anaerolineales bacterium]
MTTNRSPFRTAYDAFAGFLAPRAHELPPKEQARQQRLVQMVTTSVFGLLLAGGFLAVWSRSSAAPILAIVGMLLANLLLTIPVVIAIRRNRLDPAAILILFQIVIIFGGLAFFLSNAAANLIITGSLYLVFIGYLILPNRRFAWLATVGSLGLLVFAAEQLEPFARYDIRQSTAVSALIIGGTVLVAIITVIQGFRNMVVSSIRARLTAVMIVVGLLPAAIASLAGSFATRQVIVAQSNQALLGQARQTAVSIDSFIQSTTTRVRTQAGLRDFSQLLALPAAERPGSAAEAKARQLLTQLATQDQSFIATFGLVDAAGINVADRFLSNVGMDESHQPYVQVPLQTGQTYVSDLLYATDERGYYLVFSAPVKDSTGRIVGVLRMAYSFGAIRQLVYQAAEAASSSATALLLDEHGIRLADASNPEDELRPIVPLDADTLVALQRADRLPADGLPAATDLTGLAAALQDAAQTAVFTAELHPDEPSDESVAIHRLETKPWTIIFGETQAATLAPNRAQNQVSLFILLALTGAIALLSTFLVSILSRPVLQLTAAAEQIIAGDLNASVDIRSEDQIGTLAASFNTMTTRLRETIDLLEQRVAERTRALATSAEVSRRLATILDQQTLMREVVTQIQAAFDYYHVHIYLFDPMQQHLVMAGGTGEAGEQLLADEHVIQLGQGLVGQAAETGTVVLAGDVSQARGWLPNPLLPETRAEAAVPITLGDEVLGILDVQHDQINGLAPEDVDMLQSIAYQVAVALRNARLYGELQAQAQRANLVNEINQRILQTRDVRGALHVAMREIGQATGASTVRVKLPTNGRSTPPSGE